MGVFEECLNLKEVILPNGVTRIGGWAFSSCRNLSCLIIPGSVTRIDTCAFQNCDNLTSIVIPQNVNWIGERAFAIRDAYRKTVLILNKDCVIFDKDDTLGAPSTTTVLGCLGSTAEDYALKHGYSFKTTEEFSFIDVSDEAYYAESVAWAIGKGITNGTSPRIFSPDSTCTRAQAVTFLWRAAGSPEPNSSVNPFVDVSVDQYYSKAVMWAMDQGITNGVDATHFAPDSSCTRGQVVTFLWRAEGKSEPEPDILYLTDMEPEAYYFKAVMWALERDITNGTSATTFSPNQTCTRAQIVTFLYRANGAPEVSRNQR